MHSLPQQTNRLLYLETARGIASVIVLIHHFALGFIPSLRTPYEEGGIIDTPLFALANGAAAVSFFFLLSGFVLSIAFFHPQASGVKLASAAIKRLPRLMLPAAITIFAGYFILSLLPAWYQDAAQISGSAWLNAFGYAGFPENHTPTFLDALKTTLMVFLVTGEAYYNSNLWTMHFEFAGSLLVFAIAYSAISSRSLRRAAVVTVVMLVLGKLISHHLMVFVMGTAIALAWRVAPQKFQLRPWATALLLLLAIAGYSTNDRWPILIASIAAFVLLLAHGPKLGWLNNRTGVFLGKLSFPLYLVHTLVILAPASWAYSLGAAYLPNWANLGVCFLVTLALSLVIALPFIKLEKVWVPFISRCTDRLLQRYARPKE